MIELTKHGKVLDKESDWISLEGRDPHCFACGQENIHGLQMKFMSDGERLRSKVTVPDHLRGWHNLVHGGILSTLCDEAMSWSAIYLLKRFILTKNMNVSFLKPVTIGSEVTIYGHVGERVNDRKARMCAEVVDEAGDLCVTAEGTFVLFTLKQFAALNVVPEKMLEEMSLMFREM